ncbi:MAG: Lactate-binding periplasmic protein precursor [Syntrophorhabdaceae bacterium PtaU1.Bin034]|jgi:TRAP-type C4-dicarboxylate transport system substrate-binding protein|nr:MAG: Lactate-binding periplasmic protein precursor [Syntrophorhabdaceae bacterium PtaU1.Bin034]
MRGSRLILFLLCLAVIGFSFSGSSAFSQSKVIELTYAQFQPATHFNTKLSESYAKEIEKRTNGKVKITVFPGGTLISADKTYNGIVTGITDMGQSCMAYTRGKFPLSEVIDLPLGYKTGVAATKLINSFYEKFKPREFAETEVMYFMAHSPGIVHCKKPVYKLEDLRGQKIRCTGLAAKVVAKLGAVPVAMPMGETYDALSRGVVDGTMAPQESTQGWRWGEVVSTSTQSFGAGYTTGFFVVMNKKKWNSLPPEVQKVFREVNREWADKNGIEWDLAGKRAEGWMTSLGKKIVPLSAAENARWAELVRPLLNEYVESMKRQGLPGKEALDFCVTELKKLEKQD